MKASGCLWNALTVFFIAMSVVACVWAGAVFMNPQGPFNPLKPVILDVVEDTPEPEGTPTEVINFPTLPPVWTATFTPQPTTATPTQTHTPAPTETVVASPVGPTATQSETPQPTRTPSRTPAAVSPSQTPESYAGTSLPPSATPGAGYP